MKQFIMTTLGLSNDQYNLIESIHSVDDTTIFITLKKVPHHCPTCNFLTSKVKGYTSKKISHNVLIHRDTFIFHKCRRYLCTQCNRSFVETSPILIAPYAKISSKTIINVLDDLKPYNETFSSVARRYNISITQVINIFDDYVRIKRKPLSTVLCMDEFYFNRHAQYKYAFMIMDFEKKVIIDIIESRHFYKLSSYFSNIPKEERLKVEYICIDMYKAYRDLAAIYFKKAQLCMDPFHVVKHVNETVNQVRKRVMRNYKTRQHETTYKLLKYRYKLLLKNEEDVEGINYYNDRILQYHTTEHNVLEMLINIHQELKEAYQLKEQYIRFNKVEEATYQKEANAKKLDEIITAMKTSEVVEIRSCGNTLNHWKRYILNSFVWINGRRISNGPIEGKNTYLKKILSNANGLTNFERARNRFIYSQNMYERYSLAKAKTSIKMRKRKRKGGEK